MLLPYTNKLVKSFPFIHATITSNQNLHTGIRLFYLEHLKRIMNMKQFMSRYTLAA